MHALGWAHDREHCTETVGFSSFLEKVLEATTNEIKHEQELNREQSCILRSHMLQLA